MNEDTQCAVTEAEEEKIEALFWKFDSYRKEGSERDAFKGVARRLIRETKREAAEVVKHLSTEDGIGMGSQRIERAIRGRD